MYERIAIIGIGSLGGFVANSISFREYISEIIVIDYDIVESKNIRNSIYKKKDVGKFKVDVMTQILENNNEELKVIKIKKKFIENNNEFNKCDLVIDCRDFTYNRGKFIDVRLYISSRYLIVDCRKNVQYEKKHKGKYISNLTKADLRNAGFITSTLIDNLYLSECIKEQGVYKFDLDYLKEFTKKKTDIVYDVAPGEEMLINLSDNIFPILNANKKSDLKICVGSKEKPIFENMISKNTLKDGNDVISNLVSSLNIPCVFNTFVIALTENRKEKTYVVELIPETGAA